ncbi:gamma-butyrobetaine hydroxylase family protein [Wenzhouxiangella sp. EGI_FJ10305]|uniref:gamma-butyrobetaine hydroxylase-like domain-containing protein n=1 Tax=Wenzhouxiangella sp. EGI_FJ10305 TaxID=3243768 RepID=UPI0035D77AE7
MTDRQAVELRYERSRRMLVVNFDDGEQFELPAEYLRTHSPSAEVRGHGYSEPKLMTGKEDVDISAIEPVGGYAVQITFDDGHDSGIYSWSFLYDLGENMDSNLDRYRQRLSEAGLE